MPLSGHGVDLVFKVEGANAPITTSGMQPEAKKKCRCLVGTMDFLAMRIQILLQILMFLARALYFVLEIELLKGAIGIWSRTKVPPSLPSNI